MPKRGEIMSPEQRAKIAAANRRRKLPTEKRCTRCGVTKPAGAFYVRSGHLNSLRSWCKACELVENQAWQAANPDKVKAHQSKTRLKMRNGLLPVAYAELLAEQGNRCAICGNPPSPDQRLSVDHCHETGRRRGLLCFNCNTGLGCFRDRPDLLHRAASYVGGV